MTRSTPPPNVLAQGSRRVAVACLVGLVALCVAWELWLAPLRPGGSWLVLKALPLAVPLAGVLKSRLYTYRWLSLLVWIYVAEGTVRATTETGAARMLAVTEVLLAVLLFGACAAHVRARLRGAREVERSAAKSQPHPDVRS